MRAGVRWSRVVGIAGTVLAAAAIAACGSSGSDGNGGGGGASTTGAKELSLAYFAPTSANSYAQAAIEAVRKVAARAHASVTVFDGKFDVPTQLSQVQSAVSSKKFDGLILHPIDGNALVPVVKSAIASGIAVGTLNTPVGPRWDTADPQVQGLAVSALTPATTVGANLAQLTTEACRGLDPCRVAYVIGGKKFAFDVNIKQAFDAALKAQPSIEQVALQEGGYGADQAYTATQNILQANPKLDVIVSNADGMVSGAARAVQGSGRTIKLIGNGGSKLAVQGLEDGGWFGSSILMPATEGAVAAEGVVKAARKQGETGGVDVVAERSPVGPLLTRENVGKFTAEWDG